METTVGILIPTYQGVKHLPYCLPPLLNSPLKLKILIIDSSSSDGTVEYARSLGVEVVIIPKEKFNHGTTREWGRKILNTEIVVMMTQDAYPTSSLMIDKLLEPLILKKAVVSYARQLPHRQSKVLEAFARHFNYPEKSHIRCLKDIETYGIYTFFCSNSCAAYLNVALDEVGGFPSVLFGEDTVAVAKLLHQAHAIAYVAEAEVYHSHNYTLKQEFCRHFDMGLARRSYQELINKGGKDTQRGKNYVTALLKVLIRENPLKIPYAVMHIAAKYTGYRLGQISLHAPLWMKRICSSQQYYWK